METLPKLASGSFTYEAVSNPYRTTGDSTFGWTRTIYDQMGRVYEVDHFDGSTVPFPWGTANTPASLTSMSYDGNVTTITDEAGKVKKQTVDGLGRLTSVIEDPTGLNYLTSYTYDVGNNLLSVTQSSQTRTFTYDSLNRLYQATNPENGTITYTYDANGNVVTKADGRPITATMAYDCLNRIISKQFSDYAAPKPTP